MKKLFAIALAVAMFASMATVASAAENSKTTTLTTNVPAASYTLNIPADQEILFRSTSTNIGNVTITDSENFAVGKNIEVTITYEAIFILQSGFCKFVSCPDRTGSVGQEKRWRGSI